MKQERILEPAYVVKAEDIIAINYLASDHPRPRRVEWINRGTDQVLRPTTTSMLLRTLYKPVERDSVQKLHDSSGLRIVLKNEGERVAFASAFERAKAKRDEDRQIVETAVFDTREQAEAVISQLHEAGIDPDAISLLCRASQFTDPDHEWPDGHSPASIASVVAGSGVAGALMGVACLFVPGVGPVAVAGAMTASALSSVASVSAIIGATGGAVAKMLTDHDVDGVSATFYDEQIQRGRVFVSVDTQGDTSLAASVCEVFERHGGRTSVE
ncbi:MAG: hypothetical protein ABJ239_04050 [Erythrobacter sp.]